MHYKRPESVLVIVCTEAGETLLLRRCTPPRGVWQSVTGSLRWGEVADAAARRELFEETGLQARPVATGEVHRYRIVAEALHRYAPGVIENTEIVYELVLASRSPVHINTDEHDDFRWAPLDQALPMLWSWSNRAALAAWQTRANTRLK